MYLEPSAAVEETKKALVPRFDAAKVKEWLDAGFESDFWKTATLACVGCGICTLNCPGAISSKASAK